MSKGRRVEQDLPTGLYVGAIYSRQGRMPMIEIEIVEPTRRALAQLTVEQAEEIAMQILQAREAAIQDAFFLRFCMNELDLDEPTAAALLHRLRETRHAQGRSDGTVDVSTT